LLIGVAAEILIDEFWEIPSPIVLRGRKATTLLRSCAATWKRCIMIFVGVGQVGGGIVLEMWQGGKVDKIVDQIRSEQENARISLEHDLARVILGRHIWIRPRQFASLGRLFPFPTVLIQNVELDPEADRFAGELGWTLKVPHWVVRRVNESETHIKSSEIPDGIRLYCLSWDMQKLQHNPWNRSAAPTERTAQQAEQLADFLGSVGVGPKPRVEQVGPEKSNNSFSLDSSDIPAGTILVLVGRDRTTRIIAEALQAKRPPPDPRDPVFSGYLDKPTSP